MSIKSFISILFFLFVTNNSLNASIYNSFDLFNENNTSKETKNDFFMDGDFDEIIRFEQISLDSFDITQSGLTRLKNIIDKTNAYKSESKKILINIIGHSPKDKDALQISKGNALEVQDYLIDHGIDKNITSIEYRGSKEVLYLDASSSKANRVMVTMYVNVPKDLDNDGVDIPYDKCPNTEPNLKVLENGCKVKTIIVLLQDEKVNSSIEISTEKGSVPVYKPNQIVSIRSKDDLPSQPKKLDKDEVNKLLGEIAGAIDKKPFSYVLFFDSGDRLSPESKQEFQSLLEFFSKTKGRYIKIIGHTDTFSNKEVNLALGYKRAEYIAKIIEEKNIDFLKIDKQSYGESNPAIETGDGIKEKFNRRVELFIY